MRRRNFITGAASAAAAWPLAAAAQAPAVPRVGLLDPGIALFFDAFTKGMTDLGYADGKTVSYVLRSAEGRAERFAELASELVRLKVDVIVTAGPGAVRAAMQATSTIPIVMAAINDAVGSGVVKSLARPGGNATGLSFLNTEISAKRLEILHEAFPKVRRVAVLWDRNTSQSDLDLEPTENSARRIGLETLAISVAAPEEFEDAFRNAAEQHVEAIDVLASPFFNANHARLVMLAAKYRLPAMYGSGEYVRAGGLMSYGPDFAELYRRAATYVDKILRGAEPGDLPVEQATKFELLINLKAANDLGVAIAPAVLASADEVIE